MPGQGRGLEEPVTSENSFTLPLCSVGPMPERQALSETQAEEDASVIIADFLYLGGQASASSKSFMQKIGIQRVLNCCARQPNRFPSIAEYKVIDVHDTKDSDITACFNEGIAFIERAKAEGKRCLVHCMVGASRSVSIVLAYLVARESMPLQQAWQLVSDSRPKARPNASFCQQLIDYERALTGSATTDLSDFRHGPPK